MNLEHAPQASRQHRHAIQASQACGCYFCLTTFNPHAIMEWTDEGATALCPHCGIDAVLPNATDPTLLSALCERWFSGHVPLTED